MFFHFILNDFFISCRAGLLVKDSLFLFIRGCLNSPLVKATFVRCGILGWQSFSFNILNVSFLCLLSSLVSDSMSAIILIDGPLYIQFASHLLLLRFSLYLWFLTVWLWCVDILDFILLGVCWAFDVETNVFIQIWETFCCCFFKHTFYPFLSVPTLFLSQILPLCICWYACSTCLCGSV